MGYGNNGDGGYDVSTIEHGDGTYVRLGDIVRCYTG